MGFKMKGINSLMRLTSSNSPLLNTDPKIKNTEFETNLAGDEIAVRRTITTDPKKEVEKIETDNEKFLASFNNEYKKAQEGGFAGTLPEYIKQKEEKIGYKGKKVEQTRDYNVEKTPEYKIDKYTGKSYITKPYKDSETVFTREYHYPSYNTGHHEKGTLVSENEMLGNLYEKFDSNKAKRIYEAWIKKNTGKDVTWSRGNYSRNQRSGGGEQSENLTDWITNN